MQYKPCGVMDLLQGIRVVGEVVRELELESVGNLTPKLLWEAAGKGTALFCSRDVIFNDEKGCYCGKLPVVFA